MAYKVLLVGRPAMGKTTIKKVIFEKADPNELILFPLESTIDANFSTHNILDITISLLDTAGQSLPIYLNNVDLQMDIFGDTSALIYIFDYSSWLSLQEEIIEDIQKIIYIINEPENPLPKPETSKYFFVSVNYQVASILGLKIAEEMELKQKLLALEPNNTKNKTFLTTTYNKSYFNNGT